MNPSTKYTNASHRRILPIPAAAAAAITTTTTTRQSDSAWTVWMGRLCQDKREREGRESSRESSLDRADQPEFSGPGALWDIPVLLAAPCIRPWSCSPDAPAFLLALKPWARANLPHKPVSPFCESGYGLVPALAGAGLSGRAIPGVQQPSTPVLCIAYGTYYIVHIPLIPLCARTLVPLYLPILVLYILCSDQPILCRVLLLRLRLPPPSPSPPRLWFFSPPNGPVWLSWLRGPWSLDSGVPGLAWFSMAWHGMGERVYF